MQRYKRIPYRIGFVKNFYISMKFHNDYHFKVVGCLFIFAGLIISLVLPIIEGSDTNQQVYPINSKPYGSTYGEWSARWWQWALSIPTKDSPIVDETGAKCAVRQNNSYGSCPVMEEGKLIVRVLYLPEKPFSFLLLMWNVIT